MINRNPQTYNEMKQAEKVLDLARYYKISQTVLDEIYDFIMASPNNTVDANKTRLFLKTDGNVVKEYAIECTYSGIDGIRLSALALTLIPSFTSSSGGSRSSGGGSSNNNNNNKNNNNNNN